MLRLRDVLQLSHKVQKGLHSVLKASLGLERVEEDEDTPEDAHRRNIQENWPGDKERGLWNIKKGKSFMSWKYNRPERVSGPM